MILVCEVTGDKPGEWVKTTFKDVREWMDDFRGRGSLVPDPGLTKEEVQGFRLTHSASEDTIYLVVSVGARSDDGEEVS